MKKLLFAFAFVAACIGVQAQGTITFNNSAALKITNGVGSPSVGQGAAGATVALYFSTDTNSPASGLAISTAFITNTLSGANAGLFIGGTRALPGVAGAVVILAQIRAWTGAFATYEDAVTASSDGVTHIGVSQLFTLQLGGNGFPTASLTAPGKLNAFTIAPGIPEPSSIALGLLGLGAIALFRRRK